MPYSIGIYGARNTCTLVRKAGLSSSSFVSDLFHRIYMVILGFLFQRTGPLIKLKNTAYIIRAGDFGIDKNVTSGRYMDLHHCRILPFNTEQSEIPSLAKFIQFMWRKILRRLSSLLMSTNEENSDEMKPTDLGQINFDGVKFWQDYLL